MKCSRFGARSSTRSSLRFLCALSAELERQKLRNAQACYAVLVIALLGILLASGCSRVVLVTESSPIRVGPNTTARVYTLDGQEWALSDNRVTIPEGWYCVPPSYVTEEK